MNTRRLAAEQKLSVYLNFASYRGRGRKAERKVIICLVNLRSRLLHLISALLGKNTRKIVAERNFSFLVFRFSFSLHV